MKMTTVYAYRMPKFEEAPELVGLTGNSFNAIAKKLKEGDHVTVEVTGKGYKELSIKNGQVYLQRNFAYEY